MAVNLLEAYRKRLAVAETVHERSHNGAKMNPQKKLMIATVLNNTSKTLSEAFQSNAASQAPVGDYKKFCLNISNITLPNLILPELMITQPMTSFSGYVTYLKYMSGTAKGGVEVGDVFNSPYGFGTMDKDRARYTSAAIEEVVKFDEKETKIKDNKYTLSWTPVKSIYKIKTIKADGTESEITLSDKDSPDTETYAVKDGVVTFNATLGTNFAASGDELHILYLYDNVEIPQSVVPTSLPTLKAHMVGIPLQAKARRIAIYYSQISAFQAKNDYGFDLGDQLAQQASGELQYEIDSEGVLMLHEGAEQVDELTFPDYDIDKVAPLSRSQYYEGFSQIIAKARAIMYKRTGKFTPTYMVAGSNVLTILPFLKGWEAAPAQTISGPYWAGTVDGLKVYVSPAIPENDFFFGVNGGGLQTSAGVYAPYMTVVPTQVLGFADGTMSQGFSTLYDMKLLSTYNGSINGGTAVDADEDANENGKHSYLLVGGKIEPTGPAAMHVYISNASELKG